MHSSHSPRASVPSLTPPLGTESQTKAVSSSGALRWASGSHLRSMRDVATGRLLSFSLRPGRLNLFEVPLIIPLPTGIHTTGPPGREGPGSWLASSLSHPATTGVPSGVQGTVCEESAEVHFSVAALGQEMLCCVLEVFIVVTNFGGKNSPLQLVYKAIKIKGW